MRDLRSEVEGVKNIMTQNVERILARGENLDHLRNKTEDLEATVRWRTHGSEKKRAREGCWGFRFGGIGSKMARREVCLFTCFRN